MDQPVSEERAMRISLKTAVRLWFHYVMMVYLVTITNLMRVPKSIVLLEGLFYAVAYYLRTLDCYGASLVIVAHICSILTMYTHFRILSVMSMTYFSTLYPVYSTYAISILFVRLLIYDESMMPLLLATDRVECVHIFLLLAYITYYYLFHFRHRSHEDGAMYVVVLWTSCFFPHISRLSLVILFTAACLWIENKGLRFAPLTTLHRRPLDSLSYFR